MSLPQEDYLEIQNFICLVLKHWHGFQASIINGMGGSAAETSRKVRDLTDSLTNLCCKSNSDKYELADILEETIYDDFDTIFEDGSVDEVASLLWDHLHSWHLGDKDKLRHYVNTRCEIKLPECSQIDVSEDESETEPVTLSVKETEAEKTSEMETDNNTDNDGWNISRHARRKKR